ncbi:hypothetical protein V1506DRAFT_510162 [Lipomyces tetrasporus]
MSQKKICAKDLGIDLESGQETEYFKWFLACLLFGKPVQQEVAKQTYLELVQDDRGHYVRYDFSTATKLLEVSSALKEEYRTFGTLLNQSRTTDDLSARLQEFKGVGPKTVEIFLRDMKPVLEQ